MLNILKDEDFNAINNKNNFDLQNVLETQSTYHLKLNVLAVHKHIEACFDRFYLF